MTKSGKTKKALAKRFKITRNKKIIHRPIGQDHFLAKKPGKKIRSKRLKKAFVFLPKTLKSTIAN